MAASRFTLTYPSGSALHFGDQFTISITRDSQNYRHRLMFYFNDVLIDTLYSVTNMAVYTYSRELMKRIPNATYGRFMIVCYTYNGSSELGASSAFVGSTSTSGTIYISDQEKPQISTIVILRDYYNYYNYYGAFVSTKSRIEADITGSPSYGATIKQRKVSIGSAYGIAYDDFADPAIEPSDLTVTGQINITYTVLDSRNLSDQFTQQITVVPYQDPSLSNTKVARWSNGVEDDESSAIRVSVNGNTCDVNDAGLNTGTVKIYTALYGSTDWVEKDSRTVGPGDFSYNLDLTGFDTNTRYRVRVLLEDDFNITAERFFTVETASAVMDFRGSGKGVAFGKIAETDNLFDVGWPSRFTKTITHNGMNVIATSENTAGNGSAGWITVCEIKSVGTYHNSPIRLTVASRGQDTSSLSLVFSNNSSAGSMGLNTAMCKSFGGAQFTIFAYDDTCLILVRKSESYDSIAVLDFEADPYYMGSRIQYSFPMEYRASIASGPGVGVGQSLTLGPDSYVLDAYPVGSVVIRYDHTSPAAFYGGTWQRISGAFLYATGSTGTIGATGGSGTHTLTVAQMPSHNHTINVKRAATEASGYGLWNPGNGFNNRGIVDNSNQFVTNETIMKYTGGGGSHNNNPYFINVSVWRRTA